VLAERWLIKEQAALTMKVLGLTGVYMISPKAAIWRNSAL
jgi:hypothetical protein